MKTEDIVFSVKDNAGCSIFRAEISFVVENPVSTHDAVHVKFQENLEQRVQERQTQIIFKEMYGEQWVIQQEMAKLCGEHMKHVTEKNDVTGVAFMEELSRLLFQLRENSTP